MTRTRRTHPALILALAFAVTIALPCAALAKDYSMGPVEIQARVADDGALSVVEDRTFDFSGDYTFVYWDLGKKSSDSLTVSGMTEVTGGSSQPYRLTTDANAKDVRTPGTYWVEDSGDTVAVYAFFHKSDEAATFRLTYGVTGAVKRYKDVAELYWQFVGDKWGVSASDISVRITPSAALSKSQVRAWAHGPLTGLVTIADDGVVDLTLSDLPSETFVEARVLYPATALPAADTIPTDREAKALAEEGALAEAANRKREQARALMRYANGTSIAVSLLVLALAIWAFLRYGREPKPAFDGEYLREDPRPDLPPAVIGALWRFGEVKDADITATLMALADRNVIAVEPVTVRVPGLFGLKDKQSLELTLLPDSMAQAAPAGGVKTSIPTDELYTAEEDALLADPGAEGSEIEPADQADSVEDTPTRKEAIAYARQRAGTLEDLEGRLVRLIFTHAAKNGRSATIEDIKHYAMTHPSGFSSTVISWKSAATKHAERLGLVGTMGHGWKVGLWAGAITVAVGGLFSSAFTWSVAAVVVALPCAAAIALIAANMSRRTQEGADLHAQYLALERFLRDFSRLNEAPPKSVVLWNRFLVLAVVFGIADKVLEQMRVVVPEIVDDPGFRTSYWWAYSSVSGQSPILSLIHI